MPISSDYQKAVRLHNAAIRAYQPIVEAYRARRIDDAEFLSARKVYDAANRAFDIAYAEEQSRQD